MLIRELRSIISIEGILKKIFNYNLYNCLIKCIIILDWQKTEEQSCRENLLLAEVVTNINKRDELVHHLDSQERAYVFSRLLLNILLIPNLS